MNRRLPIYFLIDVSRSMVGKKMVSVNEGLQSFVDSIGHVVTLDDFDANTFTKVIDVVSQSVSRAI